MEISKFNSRKIRRFLSCILSSVLAAVTFLGSVQIEGGREVQALYENNTAESKEEYAGYLFAYFTDSSKAIHFAVSTDGYYYTALNGNEAVVTPTVGRQASRDPYIIKGQDGDYYMLATDLEGGNTEEELKVNSDNTYTWGANTSIVTWHSTDLVEWDRETKIDILGVYDQTKDENQKKVWAPEAIYDEEKKEYMIYWSMEGGSEYGSSLMIWYAYTKDFQTLTSEPKVLFNPSPTGLNLTPVTKNNTDCIDANIVENDGKYYLYYKWSSGTKAGIQVAVADSLKGNYLPVNYDESLTATQTQSAGNLCGSAYVEGGDVYQLDGEEKWILISDHNWSGYYGMSVSEDLINWTDVDDCRINFSEGDGNPKHGAVIKITRDQYNALWAKWEGTESEGTAEMTEGNDNIIQSVAVLDATEIREDIDSENHVITKYISRNNSTHVNLTKAGLEFEVLSGYKISGLKGIYDLTQGAKVTVTSLTDSSDYDEWTIKAVSCNNPALGGLYADPDIDVFDGKYYIYPTTDGYTGWNTKEFHVFSSDNLVDWKDEGVILDLSSGDVEWVDTENCYAWAPAIERKNGKYYFYFCGRDKSTNRQAIGVAVSDSPTGPFVAEKEPLMTLKLCRAGKGSTSQVIDPSIYTDEDTGVSYMLFGNGDNGYNIVELNSDMISYKEGTIYHYPSKVFPDFRESIHVFKKGGKYHFTWSCDDTGSEDYSIGYAVADSLYPEKDKDGNWGTFTAEDRGKILVKDVDNDILGTGHHCMLQLPGTDEWYIAYARFGTPLSDYEGDSRVKGTHREVCIDKVSFDEDGYIIPIKPTLSGIQDEVYAGYSIEYNTSGGGTLKDESGNLVKWKKAYYSRSGEGTMTLTAVADNGKKFVQWSDGVKTATRTDTGITSDAAITAYFADISVSTKSVTNKTITTASKKTTRSAKQVAKDKKAAKKAMKQAKITKLKVKSKAKKKITVSWKKVKKAKGYQVQVSKNKKFKKKKIIYDKLTAKKKLVIKGKKIKRKKTYYVRVRAYATYKDKYGKAKKVYSKWNKKLRKVKIK